MSLTAKPGTVNAAPHSYSLSRAALVWLLAALFSTQPMATDLYLASLPALREYFAITPSAVQLTLSVYIASFAICQLVVGPIADRYGRRPVVLTGASLYLLGSLIGTFTPTFTGLIIARCLQAMGSSCTVICARALVRDVYEPKEGAHTLSMAFMLMSLVPLVAPVIGGFLQSEFGWRANFAFISTLSLMILLASYFLFSESLQHKNPAATHFRQVFANYFELARAPALQAYTLTSMFSYGCLFAFISGSPFVMIKVLGVPERYYGFCFGGVTLGFIVGSRLLQRALPKLGIKRAVGVGAMISVASGLILIALASLRVQSVAAVLVPMFGIMVAHGFIQPASQAGAIGPFPEKAGAAAALVGFGMYCFAALVGSIVGLSFNGTTLPLAGIICAMSVGVAFSGLVLVKRLPAVH